MERLSDILGKRPAETDVAVIGDALIDYQYWVDEMPPVGGDTLINVSNRSAGGSAANTAVALGALGVSTAFIGRIGSDENGEKLVKALRQQDDSDLKLLGVFDDGERDAIFD